MSDIIRRVKITGLVQGVGFRAFVEDKAAQRRLAGWVRNRRDGSVEALFAGPAQGVKAMIVDCRAGPRGSRVTSLEEVNGAEEDLDLRVRGQAFSFLPTI